MKPREKKPEIVYRIVERATGQFRGAYSRACCDEYDFSSPDEARHSNCWGTFEDKAEFKIARYRVVYELLEDDVDVQKAQE